MKICSFFGHRKVNEDIESALRRVIIDLIVYKGVERFYVGCNGAFDETVYRVLKSLYGSYVFDFYVVLAYMPGKRNCYERDYFERTLLPDVIDNTPKRFAIDRRNRWMIEKSEYVICYVRNSAGSGAAFYRKLAIGKGKITIDI